jgi:RsiW-degrading membrane proteinase PrsW (M82 family)
MMSTSLETGDILGEVLSQPLVLIGLFVAVAIVAPMIEEAVKALGLRLMRRTIQRPIDGLTLGMLIGIGFGVMESGLYLSSLSGWLIGGWLRLSTLILHGIATSLVGVAYARSLISGKRGDVLAGYGRAVLLHGLWNASAIGIAVGFNNSALLCLGLPCLIILLLLIVRMIPRTVLAGVQTVIHEGYQQAGANLPAEWSPSDYGIGWRLMGSRPRRGVRVVPEATLESPTLSPGDQSPGYDAAPD